MMAMELQLLLQQQPIDLTVFLAGLGLEPGDIAGLQERIRPRLSGPLDARRVQLELLITDPHRGGAPVRGDDQS